MSWSVVKLADGAQGARESGGASFRVLYLIQGDTSSDAAIDPAGALAVAGLPTLGTSYGESFPAAVCTGVRPACLGNGWEYSVECSYSTMGFASGATFTVAADATADDIGGGFPDGYDPTDSALGLTTIVDADGVTRRITAPGQEADPRRLPWQFEMSAQAFRRERYSMRRVDDSGDLVAGTFNPNINTAGQPFSSAVTEDQFLPVFNLSKNVPDGFITPASAAAFEGSTNETALSVAGYTLGKRQGLIVNLRLRRAWFGSKLTPFWELALSIAVHDPTELSDIWVLQRGFRQVVAGAVKPIMAGGREVSTPALLDVNGATTNTPYYRKFARSNIRAWSALKLPAKVYHGHNDQQGLGPHP